MERHNDAYGTCPRCEYVGWHKYKKKAIIFGEKRRRYKVSLFKCPKCGKKFGFELDGDIPVATVKSPTKHYNRDTAYSSYYRPPKEEEKKDEFNAMLEALYDEDEPKYYRITPDDMVDIVKHLDKVVNCVDHGNLDADTGGSILHNIASIRKVIYTVADRG